MLKLNIKSFEKISPSQFLMEKINVNCEYEDFVKKREISDQETLVCPTDAIDIFTPQIIDEKCIECLLCLHYFPKNSINFNDESSFDVFSRYVKKEKKFLTQWIGFTLKKLNLKYSIAYEVKISGGSRPKRIPLVILYEDKTIIFKVVNTYKDIESTLLNLQDVNELIIMAGFAPARIVLVPNETNSCLDNRTKKTIQLVQSKNDFLLITIEELWELSKNIIEQKNTNLHEKLFSG
tara:strand:- start:102 stop:809 length:708 start_codon:yes stop_codon:yes gene_type:complete